VATAYREVHPSGKSFHRPLKFPFVLLLKNLFKKETDILRMVCVFRELCRAILDQSSVPGRTSADYQLGTTRVFMRENLERHLEKERSDILRSAAVTLQVSAGYLKGPLCNQERRGLERRLAENE